MWSCGWAAVAAAAEQRWWTDGEEGLREGLQRWRWVRRGVVGTEVR